MEQDNKLETLRNDVRINKGVRNLIWLHLMSSALDSVNRDMRSIVGKNYDTLKEWAMNYIFDSEKESLRNSVKIIKDEYSLTYELMGEILEAMVDNHP